MPTDAAANRRAAYRRSARNRVVAALGAGDLDGLTVAQLKAETGLGRTAVTGWLLELMRDELVRAIEPRTRGAGSTLWQLTNAGERQWFRARRAIRAELAAADAPLDVAV